MFLVNSLYNVLAIQLQGGVAVLPKLRAYKVTGMDAITSP